MTHLVTELRFAGQVVEHRVLRLRPGLMFGDHPEAVVSHPGSPQRIERRPDGWWLDDLHLRTSGVVTTGGAKWCMTLQIIEPSSHSKPSVALLDAGLLLAMASAVLGLSTWAAAERALDSNRGATREVAGAIQAWVFGRPPGEVAPVPAGPAPEHPGLEDWSWRPVVSLEPSGK